MINVVAESDIAKIAENLHNASQKINGKIRRNILRVSLSIPCSREIVFVTTQQTEKLSKKGVYGGVSPPYTPFFGFISPRLSSYLISRRKKWIKIKCSA